MLLRYGRPPVVASEALPRSPPPPLVLKMSTSLLLRLCRDHQALTMGDVVKFSALEKIAEMCRDVKRC